MSWLLDRFARMGGDKGGHPTPSLRSTLSVGAHASQRLLRRVLVVNSKGGCGKSTIATNLAALLASKGYTTTLVDYDPQGSSAHWLEVRGSEFSAIHGIFSAHQHQTGLPHHWHSQLPVATEWVVIDSPAGMTRLELTALVRGVDSILVPVLPSPVDIHACEQFLQQLRAVMQSHHDELRVGLVANRVRSHTRILFSLLEFVEVEGLELVTMLRDTQRYIQAGDHGLSIHDGPQLATQHDLLQWQRLWEWLQRQPQSPSVAESSAE